MKYQELMKQMRSGQPANIYLFTGPEEYIAKMMEKQLIQTVIPEGLNQLNVMHFKDKDFDDVMAMAEGRPVFFINAVMPDSWEAEVNRKLARKVSEYPNARLFDWYGYSKKQTQYFYKDRTHLKDAGQKYYADFVTKNINDYFNKLEEKNTDSVNGNTLNQEKSTKLENVKIQNIVK